MFLSQITQTKLRIVRNVLDLTKSHIGDSNPLGKGWCHFYTDGSQRFNQSGWGVVGFFSSAPSYRVEMCGKIKEGTVNSSELMAVIESVKLIFLLPSSIKFVVIHTDSQYVEQGINRWIGEWKYRGWKTSRGKKVKNVEMWKQLNSLIKLGRNKTKIEIKWIKGHSGIEGNEIADRLAKEGRDL